MWCKGLASAAILAPVAWSAVAETTFADASVHAHVDAGGLVHLQHQQWQQQLLMLYCSPLQARHAG